MGRYRIRHLGMFLLAWGLATPAAAVPLATATMTVLFAAQPPVTNPAPGAMGSSGPGLVTLTGGTAFNTVFSIPVTGTNPLVTNVVVSITNASPGAFSGIPVSGVMPFFGSAVVFGLSGALAIPIPTLILGTTTTIVAGSGSLPITIRAQGWTTGAAVVTGIPSFTVSGTVFQSSTVSGTNNLTPGGVGTISLVTPIAIDNPVSGRTPVWGVLTLTFVPEPGTALLLGGGIAGLAAWRRRGFRG